MTDPGRPRATSDDETLAGDVAITGDAPAPRLPRGELVAGSSLGRYVVLARIGAGGMGVVHAGYDPELDRKVALKVLRALPRSLASTEGRTRLVREAQALAKLSHPNVVAVYDVGTVDERVWMAMEFVKGQTLRGWLEEEPRGWSQVLQVMVAAGEGLGAAHAEGLLHRDFKPDNVMIDTAGRVRVMDFGLAREGSEPASGKRVITGLTERSGGSVLSDAVTRVGSLMGTPGYMSPEQLGGAEVDERADQFAFGVTLWEALYGRRPYVGDTIHELTSNVLEGRLPTPPVGASVPGWLRRICERSLASEPSQRFPSLRALLDALTRGRARARRRLGVFGAVAVGAVGLLAFGVHRWDVARRIAACEAEGAAMTEVWNDDARTRVREGILASGVSHAGTTADKVMPWIDREAAAWAEHRAQACVNATVARTFDEATFDRAQWCLEERRLALASLAEVLARADATTTQQAVQSASALEPSVTCLHEDVLVRALAPPDPALRPRIAAVRAELARAAARARAGRAEEGLASLDAMTDEVEAIAWGPLSAGVAARRAGLLMARGSFEAAEQAAVSAYLGAAEASAWSQAAEAALLLIPLVGRARARPDDGRLWAEHARIAIGFAADPLGFRESTRQNDLAGIALAVGEYPQARALYQRSLELVRESVGADHPLVGRRLVNLGAVAWSMGDVQAARAAYEEALSIIEQAEGPEHPDVAVVLGNLAAIHHGAQEYREAQALYERALAIETASLGPDHPELAASIDNLALIRHALGRHDEALELQQRALAAWERGAGLRHPNVALSLFNLGSIQDARGRPAEALAAYERAVEILDEHEGLQPQEPEARFAFAQALVRHGGVSERALEQARLAAQGFETIGEGKAEELAQVRAWLEAQEASYGAVEARR
ncbi:tetratricopeptide repeat protein [Paraliomyxa miuraensis]|uniref:serine/threonine-protein kinase n=1 Tax=Paraliomyxa miuraensis TaxID=376150 RepID=UPI002257433D|nr:serine/threonine-protein kinase [Paraliomyxa miuraensis]MCX4245624.1 serine/threonine-protein kinase [Paraliomyxa miuraensis]